MRRCVNCVVRWRVRIVLVLSCVIFVVFVGVGWWMFGDGDGAFTLPRVLRDFDHDDAALTRILALLLLLQMMFATEAYILTTCPFSVHHHRAYTGITLIQLACTLNKQLATCSYDTQHTADRRADHAVCCAV